MKLATVLLVALLGLLSSGCASLPQPEGDSRQAGLDRLFSRLQSTDDAQEAAFIETAIRNVWSNSGRADVDTFMVHGTAAIEAGRYDEAELVFGEVIALAPDFVEGWHMRAMARYLVDDYAGAVTDLREVLLREPRHFGALVGLGEILAELGKEDVAIRVFEYALGVHPYLGEARAEIRKLKGKQLGSTI
jgi:Flp pilus assembly protein TadD